MKYLGKFLAFGSLIVQKIFMLYHEDIIVYENDELKIIGLI